jgi:hypothetical protein
MPATKRLYIIYGFAEGPKLAKQLRQELANVGVELVRDMRQADIILSHSGGCFFLPQNAKNKTIVIANPVCGSLWRLPLVISKKIWWDFRCYTKQGKTTPWIKKTCWNLFYIAARMDRSVRMMRLAPRYQYQLPTVEAKRIIVLNNRRDPWAKLIPKKQIAEHSSYIFMTRPGPHDDLWANPRQYLDILQ